MKTILAFLFAGALLAQGPTGGSSLGVTGLTPIPPNTVLGNNSGVSSVPTAIPFISSFVPGAQAIYLFNEGSGSTIHDTSGNGYDCTILNAFTWLPVQGVTSSATSEASCPGAAFNNAGVIHVWLRAAYLNTNNFFLYANVSGAQLGYMASSKTLIMSTSGGANWNQPADPLDGNMSIAYNVNPFAVYINGKTSFGTVETPVNITFAATSTVRLGVSGQSFVGNIYGIVVYPSTLTAAQIAQNDAAMWNRLQAAAVFPRDIDTSKNLTIYPGDSLTANANSLAQSTSIATLTNSLRKHGGSTYNLGQGGQTSSQILANYSSAYGKLLTTYSGGTHTVSIMASVNDVSTGISAATTYSNLNTFCNNVHSSDPAARCLVATISPVSAWSGAQQTVRNTLNSTIYSNWLAGTISADGVIDIANDPIIGNQSLTANTTWWLDGTHFTVLSNGIAAQRFALAQCLLTNQPCQLKLTVPYQYFSTGAIASTTATVNLLQLGPKQKICGVTQRVTTAFAGTSITAITASVGDSVSGVTTQYATALSWFATGTQDNLPTFVSTNGIVQATVTATGANLSALTAGSADISLCVVQQ
jgi:hypothetical protein